jgi:lipoprotein-releasing system permease protein
VGAGDALIGSILAEDLGVKVGSKLRLETGQQNNTVVNIAGIFELGVRELDARYVYLDFKQAQSLLNLPGGVTVIDLRVADIFAADTIAAQVGRLTALNAESWIETNAQLMNALTAQSLSTNMIIVFVAIWSPSASPACSRSAWCSGPARSASCVQRAPPGSRFCGCS